MGAFSLSDNFWGTLPFCNSSFVKVRRSGGHFGGIPCPQCFRFTSFSPCSFAFLFGFIKRGNTSQRCARGQVYKWMCNFAFSKRHVNGEEVVCIKPL
ncbi:hypothetical protein POVWA2_023620 [Plasmodium ovale wallikeri]|uniref:Uncharacterized protein n=1 Tax=Plasmodium ovale wallikeri TaxID=864142 RepID=A0A1A8YSY8_PLAOA|nr:hypothetical protein POVWA1_023830 [Plasmodium ovale wallikeri]SBT35162.1 hypothetical protein POVWA2_023620 [Plasmodium ovale wallikeri]